MDEALPEAERVAVHELEVYKTGVMGSFQEYFRAQLRECEERGGAMVVVVVFSPSGCEAMLRELGELNRSNKTWQGFREAYSGGKCVVVTIGPTTRDYLWTEFEFEAHVCAKKPSPKGICEGVEALLRERGVL